jgi:outer membrane protein TolC
MTARFHALVITTMLVAVMLPQGPARAQPAGPAPQPPAPGAPAPGSPPGQAVPSQPAIPVIPSVPTTPPGPLALGDAIKTGLQNNLTIRQAALGVAVARAQLREAQAQKSLTLSGTASFTDNSVSGGGAPLIGTITIPGVVTNGSFTATGITGLGSPATTWLFGLTLKYPLYTGGALEAQIAIAQANVRVAEAQFSTTAQQVVLAVRQAYYGLEQAQGSVDAAQRTVDAGRENVRVTDARVRVGTSPQFDLLQAQVQLAQSEQALTRSKTVLAQAHQSLAQVLFVPLGRTFTPADPMGLPTPPGDVDALIKQALEIRPEIAQVRASEDAAQSAIDLAAAGLKPNISIQAGPQIQTSDPTNRDVVNFTGSIVLTLAILDGGLTQAKVDEARTRLTSAKVTEDQTRQQVELDVRNAFLTLNDAAEQLRSALAAQTAAREALRIANVRFQAGVGLELEVVTAVQNLATADQGVVAAQFQYNLALAQLDRAVGVPVKI